MIFSSLLQFVNKYFRKFNINNEDPKSIDKAIDDFFDKTFGDVENNKKQVKERIESMNKIYDTYNDITNPPKIKLLDNKESKKRAVLNKKALDIVKKAYKAIKRRNIFIPSLVTYKDKQVDRALQHVLCPNVEKMSDEEMIEFNNKFLNMSAKDINKLIKDNLKKYNDFMNDIIFAKTDEEFLEKCMGNVDLLHSIGELQMNNGIKDHFKSIFGGELDKDTIDEWEKLSAKGVDTATMANRLGFLMDSNTCVFETSEAKKLFDWFDDNNLIISKNVEEKELKKFNILTDEELDMEEYENEHGTYFDTLQPYSATLGFHSEELDKMVIDSNLKALIESSKIIDPIFKDDSGNVMDKDSAINKLYNKERINIFNGEIFEQSAKIENQYFSITKPKEYNPIDFEHCSKETLNNHLDNMKNILDKGNPWYMKARNIIAPNDYQKVCNLIDDLKSDNKYNKEKTIDVFNKILDYSSHYLRRKETDNKERTDLTNDRIDSMTYISDYANSCLSHYNKLTKDLNDESIIDYDINKQNIKKKILVNEVEKDEFYLEGLEVEKAPSNEKEIKKDIDNPSLK